MIMMMMMMMVGGNFGESLKQRKIENADWRFEIGDLLQQSVCCAVFCVLCGPGEKTKN